MFFEIICKSCDMREHSDWLRVKIDMNISKLLTRDIAIFLNREATLGSKRHALNIICTDKMRSCDIREHSDWLRVI